MLECGARFERTRASENQSCLIRTLNGSTVENGYGSRNMRPQTVSVAGVWQKCVCASWSSSDSAHAGMGPFDETWLRGQCSSVLCWEEACYRGRAWSAFRVLSWLGPGYLSCTLGNIHIKIRC